MSRRRVDRRYLLQLRHAGMVFPDQPNPLLLFFLSYCIHKPIQANRVKDDNKMRRPAERDSNTARTMETNKTFLFDLNVGR